MAAPFIFVPFLTIGKVKNIEFFIKKSVLALKQIMFFGIPVVFAFCSAILIKAMIQSALKQKNHEKKLTFVCGIVWVIYGVFSLFLCVNSKINDFLLVFFATVTIVFLVFVPVVIGLVYFYSLIFCCDEQVCSRRVLSHHPPIFIKIIMFFYLSSVGFFVFNVLKKTKLISFVSRASRSGDQGKGFFKSLIKKIIIRKPSIAPINNVGQKNKKID